MLKSRPIDRAPVNRVLYPRREARRLLGDIGQTLLDKLCAEGKLDRVKLGRRSMITADSIKRLISERQ